MTVSNRAGREPASRSPTSSHSRPPSCAKAVQNLAQSRRLRPHALGHAPSPSAVLHAGRLRASLERARGFAPSTASARRSSVRAHTLGRKPSPSVGLAHGRRSSVQASRPQPNVLDRTPSPSAASGLTPSTDRQRPSRRAFAGQGSQGLYYPRNVRNCWDCV
jgi:hypothetical protein